MKRVYSYLALSLTLCLAIIPVNAEVMDHYEIYSRTATPEKIKIQYPNWFKESFYDLQEDLNEAREAGKRGIILLFTQENCSHCKALIKATLNNPGVNNRVREQYDVIGIEIFSDLEVTDIDGSITPIKEFAEKWRARLTPTLLFYGVENSPLLRIMGFYPPEKFHQVLDYIEGGHNTKTRLSQYLRARQTQTVALNAKNARGIVKASGLFRQAPHNLRSVQKTQKRPTLVLFESPNCKACKRFHERTLSDPKVREYMASFHAIQLDSTDDSSRLTLADGRTLTPKQWSEELQLNYDVSVVFFDEQGQEVYRNDAETAANRMAFTMKYVLAGAYKTEQQINRWRRQIMREQYASKEQ